MEATKEKESKQETNSFVRLFNRPDRLGANITCLIATILYAVKQNFAIDPNRGNLKYRFSPFVKSLLDFVDRFNQLHNFQPFTGKPYLNLVTGDWCFAASRSVIAVQQDLVSYFKQQTNVKEFFQERTKHLSVPFDVNQTIVVHLRLEDVAGRHDYDGRLSCISYRDKLNHGEPTKVIDSHNQAPLRKEKLEKQIQKVKEKYPDKKIVIITSPGSTSPFPSYRSLTSPDPNYDLFLLSKAKVIILSRSTFALSSLFFGDHSDVYLPLWGHAVCLGLDTKYDRCHFNYFF